MGKLLSLAVFLALASVLFSDVFTWPSNINSWADDNVATGISIASNDPDGNGLICTGTNLEFTPSITSNWNLNPATAQFTSTVGPSGLFPSTASCSSSDAIKWATSARFTEAVTHIPYFYDETQWGTYVSNIGGLSERTCAVRYLNFSTNLPYSGTYRSLLSLICKGNYRLNAGAISIANREYLGTPSPDSYTFNTAGDYLVNGRIEGLDCFVPAHIQTNNPSYNVINIHSNGFDERTVSAPSWPLQVRDPVTCNPLITCPWDNVPPTATPSQVIIFSFRVHNTMNVSININSVTLSPLSPPNPFTGFTMLTSPLPSNIAPGTDSPIMQAQVTAPPSPGTYPLVISVAYITTNADCTGSQVPCGPLTFPLGDVVINPAPLTPSSCTINPNGTGNNAGNPIPFTATCWNGTTQVNCSSFLWTTNVTTGSMSPTPTGPALNPVSTLNTDITATASTGYVRANCTGACPVPFWCQSWPVVISANPAGGYNCSISPNPIVVMETYNVSLNVSCTNAGVPAACHPLTQWSVYLPARATVSPTYGIATNLTGVSMGTGVVWARYLTPPNDYECFAQLNVTPIIAFLQPDYIGSLSFSDSVPALGTTVRVNLTTTNIGSGANSSSTTELRIDGGAPIPFPVPPLGAFGNTDLATYDYTCTVPGIHNFEMRVDANNSITEGNEGNNVAFGTIVCYNSIALACFDYI
jgi:hypothetical protein